jgi:hypothetical protein
MSEMRLCKSLTPRRAPIQTNTPSFLYADTNLSVVCPMRGTSNALTKHISRIESGSAPGRADYNVHRRIRLPTAPCYPLAGAHRQQLARLADGLDRSKASRPSRQSRVAPCPSIQPYRSHRSTTPASRHTSTNCSDAVHDSSLPGAPFKATVRKWSVSRQSSCTSRFFIAPLRAEPCFLAVERAVNGSFLSMLPRVTFPTGRYGAVY